MKIIIESESFSGHEKYGGRKIECNHSICLPRIGEYINLGFSPAPKVIKIIWSDDLQTVIIITE